jgi:hypothetical protein
LVLIDEPTSTHTFEEFLSLLKQFPGKFGIVLTDQTDYWWPNRDTIMSCPPSLTEAIEMAKGRKNNNVSRRSSAAQQPIDLLGVVLRKSDQQSPSVAAASSSIPRAEIWIVDETAASISSQRNKKNSQNLSIRVTLSGSSEVARILDEQITEGDILRFNRVSLLQKYDDANNNFQFSHSWKDPEAGVQWFRLGHVDRQGIFVTSNHRIPNEMSTPSQRLEELARWYATYQANGNDRPGLNPLPCQRRSLSEIMNSTGLHSNIVVRITEYDCKPSTPASTRKRRRASPSTQSTMTGFATLSDRSGTMISLIDVGNRFGSSLRTAKESGKAIMLTGVVSKAGSDIQEIQRSLPSDEVVLVPTKSTKAVVLSNEDMLTPDNNDYTQDYTPTQIPGLSSRNESSLLGTLQDLRINGKSILTGRTLSFLKDFKTTMIGSNKGQRTFKSGQVSIQSTVEDTKIVTPFTIDANVIRTLCGGVNESDILKTNAMGSYAMKVLKALLKGNTVLRWTVNNELGDDCPGISKVVTTEL